MYLKRDQATLIAALRFWEQRNLPVHRKLSARHFEIVAEDAGPVLDQEEIDALVFCIAGAAPVPELIGTYPVTLYLRDETDRDDLVALIKAAKPGMVTRKL